MNKRIGFIGLGHMGYPMAANLARHGFSLAIGDLQASQLDRFIEEHPGTVPLKTADLAGVGWIITMLPNSDIVEAVILGGNGGLGLIGRLEAGTIFIDMSSSDPMHTRKLEQALAERGLLLMDAPVSGGVKRAVTGELSIMMGGSDATVESCRKILETMGSSLVHVGPTGAGHAAKALNNYVSAAGLLAVVDAMHIAERFGIDPATLTDVLNTSTGCNNTTLNKVKQYMLNSAFNSGFSLDLMVKDLGTALKLGRDMGYSSRFGDACLDTWRSGGAKDPGRTLDHTELYRVVDGQPQ